MKNKNFEVEKWLPNSVSADNVSQQNEFVSSSSSPTSIVEEIEELTKRVESYSVDITPTYEDWRNLGFALVDVLGEGGRIYYHRLSRFYKTYTREEADKQYNSCLTSKGRGITISTLFHLAQKAGVDISGISHFYQNTHFSRGTHNQNTHTYYSQSTIVENEDDANDLCDSKEEVSNAEEYADGEKWRYWKEWSCDKNEIIDDYEKKHKTKCLPTFSQDIKSLIPEFLSPIIEHAESPVEADILLLGSLAVLSACLPNLSGYYDTEESVYPNLYLFVAAKAAAGKGRLKLCRKLGVPIQNKLRREYEDKKLAYKRALKEYNESKKDNPDAVEPSEPKEKVLFIPANSSSAAFQQILKKNGGEALMFETEGDTLSEIFKKDYGNYSTDFRKAFHHEQLERSRITNDEYTYVDVPRLSVVLSGTPNQIKTLIPDVENGLFSRFIFYLKPGYSMWHDVFAMNPVMNTSYFEKMGDQVSQLYDKLRKTTSIRFKLTRKQSCDLNEYYARFHNYHACLEDDDIISSIRRLGYITFRIAMIFSAVRLIGQEEIPSSITCEESDFNAAMTIVIVLYQHADYLLKTMYSPTNKALTKLTGIQKELYMLLPEKFTKQDAIEVGKNLKIADSTLCRYLKDFCDDGLLEHTKQGAYSKVTGQKNTK